MHPYGVGVYLREQDALGHINVPAMGVQAIRDLDDYPQVGCLLQVEVLGYAGTQLRLTVTE